MPPTGGTPRRQSPSVAAAESTKITGCPLSMMRCSGGPEVIVSRAGRIERAQRYGPAGMRLRLRSTDLSALNPSLSLDFRNSGQSGRCWRQGRAAQKKLDLFALRIHNACNQIRTANWRAPSGDVGRRFRFTTRTHRRFSVGGLASI